MRQSVRAQVLITLFALTFLPISGLAVFNIIKTEQILTKQAFNTLDSIATIQKSRIEDTLKSYKRSARLITSRTELRRRLSLLKNEVTAKHTNVIQKILLHAQKASTLILSIDIIDLSDSIVASTSPQKVGKKVSPSKIIKQEGKNITVFDGFNSGHNILTFFSPIFFKQNILGMISVSFDSKNLFSITRDYTGLGETGETFLAFRNEAGNAETFGPLRFKKLPDNIFPRNYKYLINKATPEEYEGYFSSSEKDYRNKAVIAVSRFLDDFNIGIVVKKDKEEIFRPITQYKKAFLVICIGLCAVLVFVSFYLTRPIIRLAKIAQNFADGKYESTIEIKGNDEICTVARALNLAISNHKSSVEKLRMSISKTKTKLNEYYRNDAQLAAIVNSTTDAVISQDFEGNIVTWNKGAEKMLGYTQTEVIGKSIDILLPKDNNTTYINNKQLQSKNDIPTFETKRLKKDGSTIDVSMTLSLMKKKNGRHVGISLICKDISPRKKIEQRLSQNMKDLEVKNSEMEQLVYTISHDLKSPIVTASSFLEFLKEDLKSDNKNRSQDSFRRLEGSIKKMEFLTSQILRVSRAGVLELQKENLDITKIIERSLDELQQDLKNKKPHIKLPKLFPNIVADRNRTIQVFENLLSNAFKYGCKLNKGIVEIGFDSSEAGYTKFFVKDNGPGIEVKYHKKIFNLFHRLDTEEKGTGVGLSIVARIMQSHRGKVWVESSLGVGTTFWISFPQIKEND